MIVKVFGIMYCTHIISMLYSILDIFGCAVSVLIIIRLSTKRYLEVPDSFVLLCRTTGFITEGWEYMQGCALAEPSGPWHLTFALGQLENLIFFSYKSYAGHPRFYSFGIFPRAQPCMT